MTRNKALTGRMPRDRYLAWLPLVVLLGVVTALAVPVLARFSMGRGPDHVQEARLSLGDWTMAAILHSAPSGEVAITIEFLSTRVGETIPPPWPIIVATMPKHAMAVRPRTQALDQTSFSASFKPTMPGHWTVAIHAADRVLQLPITAP